MTIHSFFRHLFSAFLILSAVTGSPAQNRAVHDTQKISIQAHNKTVREVLEIIEKESVFRFLFNANLQSLNTLISIDFLNESIENILAYIFKGTDLTMSSMDNNLIVITNKESSHDSEQEKKLPLVTEPPPKQQNLDQSRFTVTGTVYFDKIPLAGAVVIVRGENTLCVTNRDGFYSISVPKSDTTTLVFSYIGMKTLHLALLNRQILDVELEEAAEVIEAAVVTGYREITADNYTGSATIITSQKIGTRVAASVEEVLRGVAPGILTASSGQPGEQNEVRLRGIGSMNADNQPLYVVDGVALDQINQTGDIEAASNILNTLNPSDIANITILKDAASAALYGSRGANGVVVITTKSGESDKLSFTLNIQSGISALKVFPQVVNGPQYAELWTEGQMHYLVQRQLAADGVSSRSGLIEELKRLYGDKHGYTFHDMNYNQWTKLARQDFNDFYAIPTPDGHHRDYDFFGADAAKLPNTDWFKEISRVAPFTKLNLSIQDASRSLKHYSSFEYFDQQGTIINTQLKRYALRVRMSSNADKQLITWGLNLSNSYSIQSGPRTGAYFSSPQYAALLLPTALPVYLEDKTYNFNFPNNIVSTTNNPVATAYENINDRPQTNITIQGWIQVNNIFPWLTFNSTNTVYYNLVRQHAYYNSEFGQGLLTNGMLTERDSHVRKLTSKNLFTADKTLGGKHRLTVIAGAEVEDWNNTFNQMNISNFSTNEKPSASMGSQMNAYIGGGSGYSLFSLLSDASYAFRYRYYLSASYRMDASSRFTPQHRVGNFWSVSGGWRVSNEPWFQENFKRINFLRIKGSYGVNGTLPSVYYSWREAYQADNYMGIPGASQGYLPNENLTWEGNRIWNVGLDLRMFKDRLKLTVEYYDRQSKDLLQDVYISLVSGYRTMLMNTEAGIKNRGLELDLSGTPISSHKHSLDFNFNLATLKSTYYGLQNQQLDALGRQIMANGYSVHTWYMYLFMGIDPETSSSLFLYHDENGNPYTSTSLTSSAVKVLDKQGIPKVSGGFSINYTFGPLSLSTLCSYGLGHYILDRIGSGVLATNGASNYSIGVEQLDRWTPDNPNSAFPIRLNRQTIVTSSSRWLRKGDYLKVRFIKMQYSIPQPVANFLKLSSASIYLQADNPFILSHIPGFDPELALSGYRHTYHYPPATTFIAGLTLNF